MRRSLYVALIFFVILLVGGTNSFHVNALDPNKAITQYKLDSWSVEDGLPLHAICAIQQTADGFLWLATGDGLVRFDGTRFKVFNQQNTSWLKSNVISALYCDKKNNLWIGTGESGLYHLKDGKITSFPLKKYPALKWITELVVDSDGTLWIGSFNNGLSMLRAGRITTYTTGQGLMSNKVRSILPHSSGNIWIGSQLGVTNMVPQKHNLYRGQPVYTFKWVHAAYEKKNGEAWFASTEGLYRWKQQQIKRFEWPRQLPALSITSICEDRDLNFWLASDGDGLLRMKQGRFEIFSKKQGLNSAYVFSVFEDREGSLWLGTLKGGLFRLRDSLFTHYSSREGLNHDGAESVYQRSNGNILIGTKNGLNRLNSVSGSLSPLTINPEPGLMTNPVLNILEDRSGTLWLAGPLGLDRYKNGTFTRFTSRDGLSYNQVIALLEDKAGQLWIGTNNGLNHFQQGKFVTYNKKDGLVDPSITCLYQDSKQNIWIGTLNGLSRFRNGKFSNYTTQSGLVHNCVECIHEDREGVLYFGTRGGISRLESGTFFNYTAQNGLKTSRVNYMLEDDRENLWIAGTGGISRIEKKQLLQLAKGKITSLTPLTYDEQDGLKTRWYKGNGLKSSDGNIWFASDKGAVRLNPLHVNKNSIPPPVVIDQLTLDGQESHIKGGQVSIPSDTQRVEIRYTATTFIKSKKITFKIKLEGFDKEWINVGNLRLTNYTDLSPGKYIFKVIAANSDGVWNHEGAALEFYKQPHWYQTWWAYTSFFVFLFMSIVLVVKWRSWKLVKEKYRLEGIVRERTGQVKEKNRQLLEQSEKLKELDKIKSRFFANISHEFRTPLTLIMGPLEQMLFTKVDKDTEKTVTMALRNSRRLLTLINQLLDLSKMDSGKLKLNPQKNDVIPFLQGLVASFESLVELRNLALGFYSNEKEIFLSFDGEKLEKAVVNLIANAVKFTPDNGSIDVTAGLHPEPDKKFPCGWAVITVSDTGPGIPESQLPYVFDRFYQVSRDNPQQHQLSETPGTSSRTPGTGIGLSLTAELVVLHQGDINVTSRLGGGTQFTIRLPLDLPDTPQSIEPQIITQDKITVTDESKALIQDELDIDVLEQYQEEPASGSRTNEQAGDVILVVEDNPDVRGYIRAPLLDHYQVVEAVDGQEGIDTALKIIPDLIISDVMMPRKDGYQLCETLKTDVRTSHIPIILLTAKASEESVLEGLETGADDYVTKPFNTRILLSRIKNLIGLRRQLQENIQREMVLQPTEIAVSSVDREFMKELKETLEKNISDMDFGVEQLAASLYMSRTTLNRKIRAITGESTNRFIQSYRLKRAAQLLKANFGNVTEVAFQVGFSDSNYFTKCFKKKFQQLPHNFIASEN